ncbi:hypothetical protein RRG08_064881 [Elysia crispata]|uniref:Uncharacterized protein n=1 Tax=Elysia crispata TaxID=231223 RepID=A0AAE0XMP1_9GAST|nr:hypothetical protein RRG08_064881 [Elysia crispata]
MQGCLKLFGFASLMLSALIIARVSLLLQDPVTRKILMRGFELTFPELFTILSYPYLMEHPDSPVLVCCGVHYFTSQMNRPGICWLVSCRVFCDLSAADVRRQRPVFPFCPFTWT